MRWALPVALAALVAIAGAQARPGGGVEPGSYPVVEDPLAGQDLHVGSSGAASILDAPGRAQVVPADDACNGPHLTGVVDGKGAPGDGCG